MTQLSNDTAARIVGRLAPEVCGNCDTALPVGCTGLFRDDGPACRLVVSRPPCQCGAGECESKTDRHCRMTDEVKPGSGAQ